MSLSCCLCLLTSNLEIWVLCGFYIIHSSDAVTIYKSCHTETESNFPSYLILLMPELRAVDIR